MKLTAEEFLREKLASEISSFGDGTTEFHTRDVEHLLKCLDEKDKTIKQIGERCINLSDQINFNAEQQLIELLNMCMTINNLSADQRLAVIRREYKEMWDKLRNK